MITPDQFSDPKFYDKKIQEINTSLTALAWIESVFPLTQIGVDDQGTFPEVYANDGTRNSIRVMPTGKSLSFFTLEGAIEQVDETDYFNVPLGLTVWADLTKVYTTKEYNYTTDLIKDVRDVLDNHACSDYSIQLRGVFSEYTQLEKIENQNVMLPFTAFKIVFFCDVAMCYVDNYTRPITYADWFLPSQDELREIGKIPDFYTPGFEFAYWSSSELSNVNSRAVRIGEFIDNYSFAKTVNGHVRACRSFTAIAGSYSLYDTGPAGGVIFYIDGTTFYETAPSDQSISQAWSNIIDVAIGTTGTAIGTGQANTTAIIGQSGHTDSAAKLCNDLSIIV